MSLLKYTSREKFLKDALQRKQHPANVQCYRANSEDLFLGSEEPSEVLAWIRQEEAPCTSSERRDSGSIGSTLIGSPTSHHASGSEPSSPIKSFISRTTSSYSSVTLHNPAALHECLPELEPDLKIFQIVQDHSWAPLSLTEDMFNQLTGACETFEAFNDTIMHLGFRNHEIEMAPPRLRHHILEQEGPTSSLKCHECSYAVRYIQPNDREGWSFRQFAVYNKASGACPSSTWIFVSLPEIFRERVHAYLTECREHAISHPFDIHLLLIEAAIVLWRPFLAHLNIRLSEHSLKLRASSPKGDGLFDLADCGGSERQALKSLEDDILDGIMAVTATRDTIKSLLRLHSKVIPKKTNTINGSHSKPDTTLREALEEKLYDTNMLLQQFNDLRNKTSNVTQLLSSFLELVNGESLKQLAQDAQAESSKMQFLTLKAQRDGSAMKALAVIGLVYLPTTIVLNFFSASFIDTSSGDMVLIGKWWLFICIGFPLTFLTIIGWLLWMRRRSKDLPTVTP